MRHSVPAMMSGFALVIGLTLTACDEPTSAAASNIAGVTDKASPALINCPSKVTESATAIVSPLTGGTVSVGGSSVTLPAGLVSLPTPVTLTLPASSYVEMDVTLGAIEHLTFPLGLQATMTIDYSRCSRSDIDRAPLAAYYIDSDTKALLENMHGTDDKTARTVTFTTGHLSSYAVAQ